MDSTFLAGSRVRHHHETWTLPSPDRSQPELWSLPSPTGNHLSHGLYLHWTKWVPFQDPTCSCPRPSREFCNMFPTVGLDRQS
jgi:hypothetical protein